MHKAKPLLDVETRHLLQVLAAREGRTQTQILREAVARYAKPAAVACLPPGIGAYRSGQPDLTLNTRSIMRNVATAAGGLGFGR